MMKLACFTQGHSNNFNLIRICAAFAVLITHSFALAIGTPAAEPFRDTLGMTIGTIAVEVFFITSGFLVTASLLNRQNTTEFILARILRIFPGLWVMLFIVFCMGLVFTTLPWQAYVSDPQTLLYFTKGATLLRGIVYNLPGVFDNNPYKNAVNGSLWSLCAETRLYLQLAALWVIAGFVSKTRLKTFKIAVVSGTLLAAPFVLDSHIGILKHFGVTKDLGGFIRLHFLFFSGASFYILKDKIILSGRVFSVCFLMLGCSLLNKDAFFLVFTATLAYMLFFIAYVPAGFIRKYNSLGDYSYGVYIYAFPVQQSIACLFPGISVLSMIVSSGLMTLMLAILSWHCLEKHALKLKKLSFGGFRQLWPFSSVRS